MKIIVTLLLWVVVGGPLAAGETDDTQTLLLKALQEEAQAQGDYSAARRYLTAILEKNPEHLEASYQLLSLELSGLSNSGLPERAGTLALLGPSFDGLRTMAKQQAKPDFLHFVNAIEASWYKAYGRALTEIDKAVTLEPKSIRYMFVKGTILVNRGRWRGDDKDIKDGIDWVRRAQSLSKTNPTIFVSASDYDFQMAFGYADLRQPPWQEVINHYLNAIELNEREGNIQSRSYAFAWHNLGLAYRKLGKCEEASAAASKALAVMEFGAAKENKRYSDFCIEMTKMGIADHGDQ